VTIVATGGLSHQVHGERCGFNNPEWDNQFLDLLANDPEALTRISHAEYAKRGGMESAEIIMWLIMRGALPGRIEVVHRAYCLPSMTAIATVIYESQDVPDAPRRSPSEHIAAHRGHRAIEGTYLHLEVSHRAY
jgi:gallate dioxygenase